MGIKMVTVLYDLYDGIKSEFGRKPILVAPGAFSEKRGSESYWVIFEDNFGDANTREIVWLAGGQKDISEEAEPADTSCPLYFFDLVPGVRSKKWRQRVKWYWTVAMQPESEQDSAWEAYIGGVDAYSNNIMKRNGNPHAVGSFNYVAWDTGWDHAEAR